LCSFGEHFSDQIQLLQHRVINHRETFRIYSASLQEIYCSDFLNVVVLVSPCSHVDFSHPPDCWHCGPLYLLLPHFLQHLLNQSFHLLFFQYLNLL
jgi:hypothetical protein